MDKTDAILCQLLLANSRLPYRELADKLNLSVTAVHKRIQSLVEAGVIRKFTAKISLGALNAVHIVIFGTSKLASLQGLDAKLAWHGSIYWLALGGGNIVYIGAYLKGISELESLVNYVKDAAGIPEPTVGVTSFTPVYILSQKDSGTVLYNLDYEIIRSLKDASRKSTAQIAEELRVSAKTVRRRLSRLIAQGLIELSIEWYPDASNDIITIFHIHLKPEADKNEVNTYFRKYSPNMFFCWGFSNIPNFLLAFVWTSTMKELQSIRRTLEQEETVQSITSNVLFAGHIFETWRDNILEK
ncbi:Lrp/AsnC family transcriptional regulator [Candidatus Bathyarchaeota archaeon]|nr:Lrp/AsnC family transcriptional regulator [Candidatus Bathyarchaeota archaeon]